MSPEEAVRRNLPALRAARGWSQQELAKQAKIRHALPWHQTTVARIERGERGISLDEACALAALFEASIEALTDGCGPPVGALKEAQLRAMQRREEAYRAWLSASAEVSEATDALRCAGAGGSDA